MPSCFAAFFFLPKPELFHMFLTSCHSSIACSRLSVVGDGEKGSAREKNEGGFLARFRSSPTTESLEQARADGTCGERSDEEGV